MIKTINIGGKQYQISLSPRMANGEDHPASFIPRRSRIAIDSELDAQQQYSCLWHEIIEVINWTYELNLEHRTITTLENAIYQVLKDNKGLV
jgi:hypothetical protein